MFSFLRKRRGAAETEAILTDCYQALREGSQTSSGLFLLRLHLQSIRDPRALLRPSQLLEKATSAGPSEHERVKRLAYLQKVLLSLDAKEGDDTSVKDALLSEVSIYGYEKSDAVAMMAPTRELELLVEKGASPISQTVPGRAAYLRCSAEFKNEPGQFEVREDGVTFTGEVIVEIPWSNAVHVTKTTRTHDGTDHDPIAIHEGKRRTPTKFAFPYDLRATYICALTQGIWEAKKPRTSQARHARWCNNSVVARDLTT